MTSEDSRTNISSTTVGGLLAFVEWLGKNHYQGKGAVKAWRIAITKVFEGVDGDRYEAVELDGLDIDEYLDRFRRAAEAKYKAESITAYGSRIKRAIQAQQYYIDNKRPPSFKQGTPRPKKDADVNKSKAASRVDQRQQTVAPPTNVTPITPLAPAEEFFELTYPLSPERMVTMRLPKRMSKREIDRLCQVLQTLEEQPQLTAGQVAA